MTQATADIETGPLPAGWKWVQIGDVSSIDYGFTATANYQGRGTPFVRITDIQNDQIDWESVPSCIIDSASEAKKKLFHGDILFARTGGTTGKSYLVANPPLAVFASYLIRVRVSETVDPTFFSYFFKSDDYWHQIEMGARGSAQPGVNATTLGRLTLPIPPLKEQKRIAAILNEQMAAVEEAKKAAEERLEAAKALPVAYLREVFDGDEAEKWPIKLLGEVGEVVAGITLGRKTKADTLINIPYLRVANVKDGYLDLNDLKEIDATEPEIEKLLLRKGDILLTEGGDPDKLGRGTIWREEFEKCIHQNHIYRVRVDATNYSPGFLSCQIGSSYGKRYFLAHAKQTTGIATINQTVLKGFPFHTPPLEHQDRIVKELDERIAGVKLAEESIQQELETIRAMPAAILRKAFAGEL